MKLFPISKTKTSKSETIPKVTFWNPTEFATIPSGAALCQRIEFILRKLRDDTWLPEKLQHQIFIQSAEVLKSHTAGELNPVKARLLVENLASTTYEFDELVLKSSTLCQIRTLDLEMNDRTNSHCYESRAG